MSGFSQLTMAVKNTFIDVEEAPEREIPLRRRARSAPAVGRAPGAEADGAADGDKAAASAQLVRLDALVKGSGRLQAGDASATTRASTTTAVSTPKAARWSDETDEETPSAVDTSNLPSLGSAGHATGNCRPCAFARSSAGCKFGADCTFCHLVNDHPETVRMRPCKGKRERLKRTMAAIEEQVARNPELLSNGGLSLPSFVDCSPQARARVMGHLAQVAADAFRLRSSGAVMAR